MNTPCKLFPYIIEDMLSSQSAGEKSGWQIDSFKLQDAWNYSQGEGVKIAVIDTGCDLDHPDLVANLLPGKNILNPEMLPEDDAGHGTHCCGIIAASRNDVGMVGVAPMAKVVPVKVLDSNGNGTLENVAKGIIWAVDQGVDIITMSLGSPQPALAIERAIKYAESKGIPIFVAAGNAGMTSQVFYPAAYSQSIAIGSIDENLDRSAFSNTGDQLDFMAPGGKIFSTIPNDWYGDMSGTSMACPFAAAIAALMLSFIRKNNIDVKLKSSGDYICFMENYTTHLGNIKYSRNKFYEGSGIIDPVKFTAWANSKIVV